jgi:hypothetical protein
MGENVKQLDAELWTVEECAEYLRVTPNGLRCRFKRGQFPKETYIYLGREIRFVVHRVKRWVLGETA